MKSSTRINEVRTQTERGFQLIEFDDRYDTPCQLQQSSLADCMEPGVSAVWLGVGDPNPQIMAKDAPKLGIETKETVGWVPYPIPSEVNISTRMHLDRKQVAWLIEELDFWLQNGEFRKF